MRLKLGQNGRLLGGSDHGIKKNPMGSLNVEKSPRAEGEGSSATSAMGSSAAAALIAGAQHTAPATYASAATRPRTEETATEIGAAVPVDQALMGKKPKVRGKKKGGKQSGLSQGARECFRKERAKDNGD